METDSKKRGITIAIADDFPMVLTGFATLLVARGFDVPIQARNGRQLLLELERANTMPNVCILDVSMPVLNGLETIPILRKSWPDMPVLVLSMLDAPHIVTRMLMEGACGYLFKTAEIAQIEDAIVSVCKNGVYFSELVTKQYWNALQRNEVKLPQQLTAAEMLVLKLCCTDLTLKQIATKTGRTEESICGLRDSVFRKLKIHSRVGLVRFAIQNGIEIVDIPTSNLEEFFKKSTGKIKK